MDLKLKIKKMINVNYWAYPAITNRKLTSAHDAILANDIIKYVSSNTGISIPLMMGKGREREIVEARHIAMFFIKKQTSLSLKSIGLFFGGRDHSTIINACQVVSDLIETNKKFNAKVSMIEYNM